MTHAMRIVLVCGTLAAGFAWAQPEPVAATGGQPPAAPAVAWSSPDLEAVATMLSGTWKTAQQVAETGGAGTTDVVMTIAPVVVEGVSDALYVEAARADALFEPYRQAIFQLYAYKGGVRLRTYEFRNSPGIRNAIVGFAYAPELMPRIGRDELIATLDLDITKSGDGYKGRTPYPYPTGVGGAVEMTSEIELTPQKLASIDRGVGADGSTVWGSKPGERYEFVRAESGATVTRTPEGVTIITLKRGEGEAPTEGDLITVHYTGYLDNGVSFDSSRGRDQAFTFRWPGQLIPGWNSGVAGMQKGERRRVIIPGSQGYGAQGVPGRIPSDARLTFDLECLAIQEAAPVAPAAEGAGQETDAHGH